MKVFCLFTTKISDYQAWQHLKMLHPIALLLHETLFPQDVTFLQKGGSYCSLYTLNDFTVYPFSSEVKRILL